MGPKKSLRYIGNATIISNINCEITNPSPVELISILLIASYNGVAEIGNTINIRFITTNNTNGTYIK